MIVIIIGMHRSGTSALAGLLHYNHIPMGEKRTFYPIPSQENLKGFFENYSFRKINDRIVEKCGYRIKSWSIEIPEFHAPFIERIRMKRILHLYHKRYEKWGWKDPRTCLTLNLWLNEIEKLGLISLCKCLFILRSPYSVANSMVNRKNTDYNGALMLWLEYNRRALEAISKFSLKTFFLKYEDLCHNVDKTSKQISAFLRHPISERVAEKFIDHELDRSVIEISRDNIDRNILKSVDQFYETMIKNNIG